jgi:thioredoxin 1
MNKVVMYGAAWCGPCKALKPVFKDISHGYLADMDVEFEFVDVDDDLDRARDAGIQSVPTLHAYSGDVLVKTLNQRTKKGLELEIEHAFLTE